MRYQISGKQIDIGTSLQEHVKNEINEIVEKFAERPTDAVVTFSKNGHEFVCESSIHLSTGLSVNATAHANEVYDSFEGSAARMEKQLRRYKRRLKDHHRHRSTPVDVALAPSYILASESTENESAEPETLQPIIVAETEAKIRSLSVGEAVMQMELEDANALVFQKEGSKSLNVVYRRTDGNIGWVDPN
jgi:ribosomal subunit interface protein